VVAETAAALLYLVAVGETPPDLIAGLASHLETRFKLSVAALPPLQPDRASYNPERRQFEADRLVQYIRQQAAVLVQDPRTRLIGITPYDLYWERMSDRWTFTFGVRQDNRVAVVSYARMDPANLGEPHDEHHESAISLPRRISKGAALIQDRAERHFNFVFAAGTCHWLAR
jgi:predicted Zn-dependent protease